jgi:hypothetical protein
MSAEQFEIPGTEQEKIPAIESAADKYVEKRNLWQGLGREVIDAKATLMDAVHLHKAGIDGNGDDVLAYHRGDYHIVVKRKEDVKVKIDGTDAPSLDDDEGGEE